MSDEEKDLLNLNLHGKNLRAAVAADIPEEGYLIIHA